jgi:hypothetical protein
MHFVQDNHPVLGQFVVAGGLGEKHTIRTVFEHSLVGDGILKPNAIANLSAKLQN